MTMFTKEINKDVPIPLYYQLKNIIKTDIENGTLKTGDTIPTEMEIMSHYNISRFTVRQAISELVNEGYLLRKPAKAPLSQSLIKKQASSSPLNHSTSKSRSWARPRIRNCWTCPS